MHYNVENLSHIIDDGKNCQLLFLDHIKHTELERRPVNPNMI